MTDRRKKYLRSAQKATTRKGRGVSAWFIIHQFDWRGMTYQIHRKEPTPGKRRTWHITGCPTYLQQHPKDDELRGALRAFRRKLRRKEAGALLAQELMPW